MKKVSIIIVNWNGINHLKKCLPSLNKITYKNYEVIIVDNGSHDDSVKYIENNFKKIKIVKCKKNLGFAGGNNKGLPHASGDFILLLNNDTFVTKNFVTELVAEISKDEQIGVVQGKLISMEQNERLDSVGAFLTNTGFLYHYGYLQKNIKKYDRSIYLYTAKGACMLIRKEVIKKVGLFDNDFFAYFEETDFCHRVWLAGYKIKYAPKSVIQHKIGGTSNTMRSAFIQFHSFKNRINSYIKNLGAIELIIILPQHLLLCELAAFSFLLLRKPGHFLAINKAIFWNLQNMSSTLRKREHVQKRIRLKTDREIMRIIKKGGTLKYYYYLFAKSLVGYSEEKTILA